MEVRQKIPASKKIIHQAGYDPTVLSEIYSDNTNLVVWKRTINNAIITQASTLISACPNFELTAIVTPKNIAEHISSSIDSNIDIPDLIVDIVSIVKMFCYLFKTHQTGVRLKTLTQAMCPRFHVDNVICRLATTYYGEGTQWLDHHAVNRQKLGSGNNKKSDETSGLYKDDIDIQKDISAGDIALLKGEKWTGNLGYGLVHRSPHVKTSRLLMTLDIV